MNKEHYYFALLIEQSLSDRLEDILTIVNISKQIGAVNDENFLGDKSEADMQYLFDEHLAPLGCKRFYNDKRGHKYYIDFGMRRHYIQLLDRNSNN